VLKNFFSILKDSDPYLRMLLITGVSKFSKVSLFSDLNNLQDITLHPRHATITGYTPEELDQYFGSEYPTLASANQVKPDEVADQIRRWYNGYQWNIGSPVYNPFSVLNLFDSTRFANYWWESGTPTFLIKQLRKEFAFDLAQIEVGASAFESYTLDTLDWRALMFQTGYLTITDYDREFLVYQLEYPNREVRDAMIQHLMGAFRHDSKTQTSPLNRNIKRSLDAKDLPRLMGLIDTLFSTIPHQIFIEKQEAFFHAVLHLTFQGLGLLTQSEVSTAKGRLDSVVYAKNHIYVMEFKLDDSAQSALDQIRNKRYGSAYLGTDKPVIAIGIGFSSETRTVSDWEAVAYEELLTEG
ncbi:MAG: AAA family ATPase, partial [Bacteroidota bacterium]